MPQAHLAQARELHQQLLAQRIEVQARLERGDVRGPGPVVGGAQALPGGHRVALGLGQAGPLGAVVGEQRLELVAGLRLPRGRGRELAGDGVALVARRPLTIRERRQGAVPTPRSDASPSATAASARARRPSTSRRARSCSRDIAREPVTALAELGDARLPGGDGLLLASRRPRPSGRPWRDGRPSPRGRQPRDPPRERGARPARRAMRPPAPPPRAPGPRSARCPRRAAAARPPPDSATRAASSAARACAAAVVGRLRRLLRGIGLGLQRRPPRVPGDPPRPAAPAASRRARRAP